MCNLYEYDMTPEVMQSLKDHFGLVGAGYLDVLRGHKCRTLTLFELIDAEEDNTTDSTRARS